MNDIILDNVASILFPDQPGQDLFKSTYNKRVYGNYSGKAKELLDEIVTTIPAYAYQNTAFAYNITLKLAPKLRSFLSTDEEDKKQNEKKDPKKLAKDALEATKDSLGIQDNIDGQKHQDELMDATQQEGESLVWGLQSNKNPNAHAIAEKIKDIHASLKKLKKTLTSISAISDSLVKGIEKIKSPYSAYGFDYGRNLQNIDHSELSYLQGEYKQLFLLKYAKGELLENSSHDKKGLGDLIIAVDTSGSTCSYASNDLNILSLEMSIALTMCKLATKNKSKIRMCMHTTEIHGDSGWIKGNKEVNKYFAGKYSHNEVVASGENDFDNILNGLFDWIEQRQYPTGRKPGIAFITDGHDTINKDTINRVNNLKSKFGVRLFTYFVSHSDPRRHAKDLVTLSDKNYWIDAKKSVVDQIDAFMDISL